MCPAFHRSYSHCQCDSVERVSLSQPLRETLFHRPSVTCVCGNFYGTGVKRVGLWRQGLIGMSRVISLNLCWNVLNKLYILHVFMCAISREKSSYFCVSRCCAWIPVSSCPHVTYSFHLPDDGGSAHLWNVDLRQRDYAVPYPRRF
jgi:hypothetical protein